MLKTFIQDSVVAVFLVFYFLTLNLVLKQVPSTNAGGLLLQAEKQMDEMKELMKMTSAQDSMEKMQKLIDNFIKTAADVTKVKDKHCMLFQI